MSERGDSCFPSLTTLERETGRARTTVARSLKELEAGGWLVVEHGGKGRANRYQATIPVGSSTTLLPPSSAVTPPSSVTLPEVVKEVVKDQGQEQDLVLDLAAAPPSRADRDSLWDALEAIFGAPGTRTAKALRGKVVTSLLEAGATAAQVEAAPAAYHQRMPEGMTLTETALEKHWPLLSVPLETLTGPPRPNMKYGRRNVTAGEMLALADRLQAEREADERKALAQG
jgi:hypothetical protein